MRVEWNGSYVVVDSPNAGKMQLLTLEKAKELLEKLSRLEVLRRPERGEIVDKLDIELAALKEVAEKLNELSSSLDSFKARAESTETCEWVRTYPRYHHDTSCGVMWVLGEENPLEHGYKYCPNCGKPITIESTEKEKP